MQNKHILVVLKYGILYSYCESIINELIVNNKVTLCIQNENTKNSKAGAGYYIDSITNSLILENISSNKKIVIVKQSENLKILKGAQRDDIWVYALRLIRETLTYISFLMRSDKNIFSDTQANYLPKVIPKGLNLIRSKTLLKIIFSFLKLIHNFIPASKKINNFICNINPDLVLIAGANWPSRNNQLSSEIDFIKSSKKLNKHSIIHVISWDNLTARGLYHYEPSLMFVWNNSHFEEAEKIHNMHKNTIKKIGAPFMDKWFKDFKIKSRKDFINSIGLDSNKSLVTYLGSSRNISKNEKIIVENLYHDLKKKDIQLIVRPHGANSIQFKNLNSNIRLIPSNGELPDSIESKSLMMETLKYSDFTVGINTTAMIDSVILGTPCISIVKDEFKHNQSSTIHFRKVQKEEIFINVSDENEIVKRITLFSEKEKFIITNKMDNFVSNFCRPYGLKISAGEKAYIEIEKLLS